MSGRLIVALAAAGLAFGQVPNVQPDIDPVFAKHGVTAIGYTAPQFEATVSGLVGEQAAAVCRRVWPYTIVLKSTNPSPVALVVLRYPRVNWDGQAIDSVTLYRIERALPRLASADGLVLTPDVALSDSLNLLRTPAPERFGKTPFAAMSDFKDAYEASYGAGIARGQVSLDSVVFADGGVVGPDRFDVIALEQGRAAVENEIIARAEDASVSELEFKAWLARRGSATWPDLRIPTAGAQVTLYRILASKAMLPRLDIPAAGGRPSIPIMLRAVQAKRLPAAGSMRKL